MGLGVWLPRQRHGATYSDPSGTARSARTAEHPSARDGPATHTVRATPQTRASRPPTNGIAGTIGTLRSHSHGTSSVRERLMFTCDCGDHRRRGVVRQSIPRRRRSDHPKECPMKHRNATVALAATLAFGGLAQAPLARAVPGPEVEYTYDVFVRRHFDFPNNDAIGYGYGICDKVSRGQPYGSVMADVKSDVTPNDEQAADYV